MIKIENIKESDLELFCKILRHYIDVLSIHDTRSDLSTITKSIATILLKDAKKKLIKIKPFENIIWQFHEHQKIVFQNALVSYLSSGAIEEKEAKLTRDYFLSIRSQKLNNYEKAS